MAAANEPSSHTADLVRSSSRTGSISTLWSSADVPLFLDPRVGGTGQQSLTGSQGAPSSHQASRYGSLSRFSGYADSSRPCSIDLERPSLSLAEDRLFVDRPDSIRVSPPRFSRQGSQSESMGRNPSISIDSVRDSPPSRNFPSSPGPSSDGYSSIRSSSKRNRPTGMIFGSPGSSINHDRGTSSAPSMPASVSSGSGLTQTGASSLAPSGVVTQSRHGSGSSAGHSIQSVQSSSASRSDRLRTHREDLYNQAHHYFEPGYSMEAENTSENTRYREPHLSPADPNFGSGCSDVSNEGSTPSCTHSQGSGRSSSGASCSSLMDHNDARAGSVRPLIVPEMPAKFNLDDRYGRPSENTPTQEHPDQMNQADVPPKELPALPSLSSFSSSVSVHSPRGFSSRHAARPRTAEQTSDSSPNGSPARRQVKGPPTPIKITRPVTSNAALMTFSQNHDQVSSFPSPSSEESSAKMGQSKAVRPSTMGSKLRSRALSASRLRPTSPWKLFGVEAPTVPAKSTGDFDFISPSQGVDGDVKPKGRLRSRTLGDADRTGPLQPPSRAPIRADEIDPVLAARQQRMRRPSRTETLASSVTSSARSFLLTPRSSNFNPSMSPAHSAAPLTPKSPARSKAKSSTGWASYLSAGLTLHIEQEGQRSTQINMSYLSYDPFGRPEDLVPGSEGRQTTPKRPKSRGDKDAESDQVGTLEFGQGDEIHQHLWPFRSSRYGGSPVLKHLTVGDDTKADLLTRQAALAVSANGTHQVSGYERKGQLAWKFVYQVEETGSSSGDKNLMPVSFSCSATLLDPARARKSRLLNMVRKQVAPSLTSNPVQSGIVPSLPSKREQQRLSDHGLPSPPSSYQSRAELRKKTSFARLTSSEITASPPSIRQRLDSNFSGVTGSGNVGIGQLSAHSIASTDSSSVSCSQPPTPASFRGAAETFHERARLQGSPVSPKFGGRADEGLRQRQRLSYGESSSRLDSVGGQLGLMNIGTSVRQTSLALQEQQISSPGPLDSTDAVSPAKTAVQTGPPRMIGGRKLIPISLPPELQKRSRIDPAQLQASASSRGLRQQYLGLGAERRVLSEKPSFASVREPEERKVSPPTGRRRSHTASSPKRPPTASEAIKLEYLARQQTDAAQQPNATAVLTPSEFSDTARSMRRQRSRSADGDDKVPHGRPFTADAWGTAMYPPAEVINGVILDHMRQEERLASKLADPDFFHSLPLLPRAGSRPRTTQNIVAEQGNVEVSVSAPRMNV